MLLNPPFPASLNGWLAWIEQQHPQHHIALGLDRVRTVFERLDCAPACPVITVTGTNGKGSTSAMLAAMLRAGGYRVGLYMSPHLLRYNERVRLDGIEISDLALCEAFTAVEQARRQSPEIELTYFEFGTLAAFWLFARAGLDAWVLEVGLGGRLDAVNIIDADVAVITAVDIDHTDYLGTSRDAIGYEKAGIARRGRPLVCGDPEPPARLREQLTAIGAQALYAGQDFGARGLAGAGKQAAWAYWRHAPEITEEYPLPALAGAHQLGNAAMVVTALRCLHDHLPLSRQAIGHGLREVRLAGRLQVIRQAPGIVCDVAHNPHAAQALADFLRQEGAKHSVPGRTIALFGMLADKDIGGVIKCLRAIVDDWWIAPLPGPRGATLDRLHAEFDAAGIASSHCVDFESVSAACRYATATLDRADRMVVFGSFLTVSEALSYYAAQPAAEKAEDPPTV